MYNAQEVQSRATILRQKMANQRKRYSKWKAYLNPTYPELWNMVGPALVAGGRYYRSEIVRLKQNAYRYAMGEEVQEPTPYDTMLIEWIDRYLADVIDNQRNVDADYAVLNGSEASKLAYRLSLSIAESNLKSLKETTEQLEKRIYGG